MDAQDSPPPPTPTEFDPFTKFLIRITGADEETLKQSPPRDIANVRAVGLLMLATFLYQAGLFSLIGHTLFAEPGHIEPAIILGAVAIAGFIMLIDSYVVFRCGWHVEGLRELARAGVDISGGSTARIKGWLFVLIRVFGLSVGLAQLTALFVSLLVFATDIHARIEARYSHANAPLIAQVSRLVDAGIQRGTDAVATQSARTTALSAQIENLRQNVIDPAASDRAIQQTEQEVSQLLDRKAKAEEDLRNAEAFAVNEYGGVKGSPGNSGKPGFGLRYRAAMEQVAKAKSRLEEIEKELSDARARLEELRKQSSSTSDAMMQHAQDQLPRFEETLKAETQKLEKLKSDLAASIAGREGAIRKAVESAPGHVGWDDGFLSQLRTLEQIADEDQKIKLVIILIDIVAFGLELAAVSAKVLGYAPTTFSVLQSYDIYMRAARIADKMTAELNAKQTSDQELTEIEPEGAPPIVAQADFNDPLEQPPRRKRGRPRKNPLPGGAITNANGQAGSGPEAGPPAPA